MFGIEVDNDIPGRYESFLHPEEKLKAIHEVAEAAHQVCPYSRATRGNISVELRVP